MTTGPLDLDDLHVVIPAGGAGTRLWPLSRAGRPKFLLDLTGSGRTLLQHPDQCILGRRHGGPELIGQRAARRIHAQAAAFRGHADAE